MAKQSSDTDGAGTGAVKKDQDEEGELHDDKTSAGRPASDSTGINPKDRKPVDQSMPKMPPA